MRRANGEPDRTYICKRHSWRFVEEILSSSLTFRRTELQIERTPILEMGGRWQKARHDFTVLPVEESMVEEKAVEDNEGEAMPRIMRVSDAPENSKFYTDAQV